MEDNKTMSNITEAAADLVVVPQIEGTGMDVVCILAYIIFATLVIEVIS